MASKIILGINNGFAAKNWPEADVWAQIIAEDLGIQVVQHSFDLLEPTIPEPGRSRLCEEVLRAVSKHRLTLHSTFTGLIIYAQNLLAHPSLIVRQQAFLWFQAALEVSQKLAVEACGGHIGAMSAADFADSKKRALIRSNLVESVRQLASQAASLGLKYFLWEVMPTPREIPHTPEEAIELMQEVNEGLEIPVCLCFDLGHCNSFDFAQPGDPHLWLEKLLPWTRVVHLQQTDGKADRHWPFTPQYNKIGIIKPERVIEIVKDSPFPEISLFFEFSHAFDASDEQIINEQKQSIEYWSKYL